MFVCVERVFLPPLFFDHTHRWLPQHTWKQVHPFIRFTILLSCALWNVNEIQYWPLGSGMRGWMWKVIVRMPCVVFPPSWPYTDFRVALNSQCTYQVDGSFYYQGSYYWDVLCKTLCEWKNHLESSCDIMRKWLWTEMWIYIWTKSSANGRLR